MSDFYMKLTPAGAAAIAAAQAAQVPLLLEEIAVGDGDGEPVALPTGTETELVNEVWRGEVGSVRVSTGDATVVIVESVIGPDDGGFTVRELAIFTQAGDLFAYGNFPETYKPVVGDGATSEMVLAPHVRVGAAAAAVLAIDPTVLLATRQWVTDNFLPVPIGGIMAISGVPPSRWLKCDGAAYLQSARPELFAKVGLLPRLGWTVRTKVTVTSVNALRYVNGNFVALGNGNSTDAKYSADYGATWNSYTTAFGAGPLHIDIVWTGTKYVVCNNGAAAGCFANSPSLATAFTNRANPLGTVVFDSMASNGAGTVVALVGFNAGQPLRGVYSTDHGDTWTACVFPGAGNWGRSNLVYAAGKFVFAAYNAGQSYIYSSPDGIVWTQVASGLVGELTKVQYFAGAFHAFGSPSIGGSLPGYFIAVRSADGATWQAKAPIAYPTFVHAGYFNNYGVPPHEATLPNGVLSLASPETNSMRATYLGADLRNVMRLRPPLSGGLYSAMALAYGGGQIMVFNKTSGDCWTAPIYDYNPATEFIVPDIDAPIGAHSASQYIRAN